MKSPDDLTQRLTSYEFYYIDKDGRARDEELWDEIWGADDQGAIQLSDDSAVMRVYPGTIKHDPFGERISADIEVIRVAFAEHDPLSMDEWENGFRRDATPEREIALWLRAAEIYRMFTADEVSPERVVTYTDVLSLAWSRHPRASGQYSARRY
jgi:hypothetical protein